MTKPVGRLAKMQRLFAFALGLPNTLIFNFRYFPFFDAIKLPVLVSHRVWLMDMSGTCELGVVRTGIVKIGFGEVGIFDRRNSRTIWQAPGHVRFSGKAAIGHGSKISVVGNLDVGNGLIITAESAIVAHRSVVIGSDVLVSWDVLIMDTDLHDIFDCEDNLINPDHPVRIGNKVWIGCRALILKGVEIADGMVIAANSTVSKSVGQQQAIVGGNPARIIREDVSWKL